MLNTRASGVLLHVTCLPSAYGVGVMGGEAKRFIKKIKDMGFSYWQVLPLNPTDPYGSPYASNGAFAIAEFLIDPEGLLAMGLVERGDVEKCRYHGSPYTADYAFAADTRRALLRTAYRRADSALWEKVEAFCAEAPWCEGYSLYCVLKEKNGGKPWYAWDKEEAVFATAEQNIEKYAEEQRFFKFAQYIAYTQWQDIKQYANEHGVKILGDMPIYVSADSADVWSNPALFELDRRTFARKRVAGVPPDYFSENGQLWGNPLYDWDAMERDGYRWWIQRIRAALKLYDTVRIDHFRAFASYWAVPADAQTAKTGEWLEGPGMRLFDAIRAEIGEAQIVAEDLGVFGEDVVQLLEDTRFPGMRVIQFGFDPDGDSTHLPHNYPANCVAYVGTHDNNTLLGYLWEASARERKFALDYCGFSGENWGEGGYHSPSCRKIIETVWRSGAKLAVIAFQDMCGFGADARMNTPGRAAGNWLYRTTAETIAQVDAAYFQHINSIFKR
ncbi:MAG: 4-alpha-glucanotransferase [Clostridia bacterium]|nr:4-alpha-glucanotransferase [Clostridia bacterium]